MKKDEMIEVLKHEIAAMPDGARFFSTRILMKRFGVGQQTVVEAMEDLIAANLIYCQSGKGYFVRRGSDRKIPHYCFVVPVFPSTANKTYETALKQYAEATGKFQVTTIGIHQHDHLIKNSMISHFDGIIIVTPAGNVSLEDIALLSKLPIPVVFWDRDVCDVGISMVCSDYYLGGAMAADFLLKKGHRQLAILIVEPACSSFTMRCRGFIEFARMSGAEVEVIDISGKSWDFVNVYDRLTAYLSQNGINFTGFFASSSDCMLEVYKCFKNFNRRVPEDISVIVHDHLPQHEFLQPPVTSIQAPCIKMVEAFAENLPKLIAQEIPYFQIRVTPEIVVRESVAAVPAASGVLLSTK